MKYKSKISRLYTSKGLRVKQMTSLLLRTLALTTIFIAQGTLYSMEKYKNKPRPLSELAAESPIKVKKLTYSFISVSAAPTVIAETYIDLSKQNLSDIEGIDTLLVN